MHRSRKLRPALSTSGFVFLRTESQTVSIPLGPLLFLLYFNDLAQTSRILKAITFTDDTNLFYTHENININILFHNINIELQNLCDWFSVNKLNNDKTKYGIFHKPSISDYIHLKFPPLYKNNIYNKVIKRVN